MTTNHSDYGVTATITDKRDGTARLVARCGGKKVHDKIHKNRKAAENAWRRRCG